MIHLRPAFNHPVLLQLMLDQKHLRLRRYGHLRIIKRGRSVRKTAGQLQHDHGFTDARAPAEDHLRTLRQHVSADPEFILRNALTDHLTKADRLNAGLAENHKLTPRPPSGSAAASSSRSPRPPALLRVLPAETRPT